MHKSTKNSVQQLKYRLNQELNHSKDNHYFSSTPMPKYPFRKIFGSDMQLNRSMENKHYIRDKQSTNSSTLQKNKHTSANLSLDIAPFKSIPNFEPARCSSQYIGIIKGYAANTDQGIVRDYNEDRVSIILNIAKPQNRQTESWPRCSFFGVYDGHGGSACADFLRDKLHQFVVKEPEFPQNPQEALRKGFHAAELSFQEYALSQINQGMQERSGSCAIVALIVGDTCYIANVGDSRAVLCQNRNTVALSRDHKPTDELEQIRIQKGGGKIYQTQAQQEDLQILLGPLRILPGRLSVSRTFGDIEAKLEKLGGKPNVIIAEPEIKSFKITEEHQFIALACDGIYDKLSSKEVVDIVQNAMEKNQENIHVACSLGVEAIMRESIRRKTLDNITVVVIAFAEPPKSRQSPSRNKSELEKRETLKKTIQSVYRNGLEIQKQQIKNRHIEQKKGSFYDVLPKMNLSKHNNNSVNHMHS